MLQDRQIADIVTTAAAAAAALALVLAVVANVRLGRLRRSYGALQGDGRQEDFVSAVGRQVQAVEALRGEVGDLSTGLSAVRTDVARAIRHVSVVRYDAFPEMGGRLSFSAALLDDGGDGIVVTSINGRTESRAYAKGIKNGRSEQSLSPEEAQAVSSAAGRP